MTRKRPPYQSSYTDAKIADGYLSSEDIVELQKRINKLPQPAFGSQAPLSETSRDPRLMDYLMDIARTDYRSPESIATRDYIRTHFGQALAAREAEHRAYNLRNELLGGSTGSIEVDGKVYPVFLGITEAPDHNRRKMADELAAASSAVREPAHARSSQVAAPKAATP